MIETYETPARVANPRRRKKKSQFEPQANIFFLDPKLRQNQF